MQHRGILDFLKAKDFIEEDCRHKAKDSKSSKAASQKEEAKSSKGKKTQPEPEPEEVAKDPPAPWLDSCLNDVTELLDVCCTQVNITTLIFFVLYVLFCLL